MGTNTTNKVLAPKNIERLEEISRISKEKEREEYDAEDDYDHDFDDGPLNILGDDSIDLGIEDLSLTNKNKPPKTDLEETFDLGIEVLA